MKKPTQLLIVCCALAVCLVGCSSEDGAAENAANITRLDPSKTWAQQGLRPVITFGAGAAKAAKQPASKPSPAKAKAKAETAGPAH